MIYECDRCIVKIEERNGRKHKTIKIKPDVLIDPVQVQLFNSGCPDKKCKDCIRWKT